MDWSGWRDEFPTFRTMTYLNTCSLAPLASRVRAAQERFLDEWEALGASAWYELWVDALDSLRGKVARVLGARREEIALAPSVSVALSAVASALDYAERPRIVLSDLEFPTLSYQWAVKPAAERVFVPSKDGIRVLPDLFESSANDRTALVATSHVYYTSGAVQDIRAIAKAAHGHGALALIDAYQATGQLPTDVHAADIDMLVTDVVERLSDAGYTLKTPDSPAERAGIVAIQMRDPPKAVKALAARKFVVDYRHDRLRVSPYFYNSPDDNERFVQALRAATPPVR